MRHMRSRRILAMLLALSMIFGLLTTTAFAGEVDQNTSNVGESAANGTSEGGSGEGQSSGASEDESSEVTNKEDVPTEEETIPEEKKTTSDEEVDTQEGEEPTPVETQLTNYVMVGGIAGFEDTKFASFEAAYEAIKPTVATLGLIQESPANAAAFDAVFTDVQDGIATLTYTIAGNITYDETNLDHLLTMGRQSSHYLTNERHLINFKFVGANGDRADTLTINSDITLPYEWWGENTTTSISFEDLTITGSAPNGLYPYQSYFEGIDFTVNNCTLKGIKIYNCANVGGSYTITNSTLNGMGAAANAYAIHLQGHETAPLTITISGNEIFGYDRGINIDQKTANATISGNAISVNDSGRSCIQLTQLATTEIKGNTLALTGGNALTLHNNLLKLSTAPEISITGNTISGTGYLIYDDAAANNSAFTADTLKLTYGTNTVDNTVDMTQGVKDSTVVEAGSAVQDAIKGTTSNAVTTSEELADAIANASDGDTIKLAAGEFTTYGNQSPKKSLIFVGSGEGTVWTIGDLDNTPGGEKNGDYSFDGCDTITFKNMTLKSDGADYRGFIRISNTIVDDCVLSGKTAYWGYETAKFINSKFNAPEGDYALWDYSSKSMSFDGCEFNISGKGVNVYVEAGNAGTDARKVEVKDCTVNSTKANKAFLNIKNSTQAYDVTISGNNTVKGLADNSTTGSNLYQVETTEVTEASGKPLTVKQVDAEGNETILYQVKKQTGVATVGGVSYDTLEEAFAALSDTAHTLTLNDESAWDATTPVYWAAGEQNGYAATLAEALTAAYKADAGNITIVCRPSADVGTMTHGHVADDLTIYGNNAYVSAGECDLEVDTYKYDRSTGMQYAEGTGTDADYLGKDITITAYELDNLGVWGQRHTSYTVNVNLTDCDTVSGITVQRVYISGTTGTNNITLSGCDFETKATSVYSNADGKIEITDCTFTGAQVPVNFNHKANGEQTVTVTNSTFTSCGDNGDWKQFAAPVRFVNSGSGSQTATVDTCKFTDTVGSNGDILIGDGRAGEKSNDVSLTVTNTEANIQAQQPGYYNGNETDTSKLGTATSPASGTLTTSVEKLISGGSTETTNVAKVGETEYETLAQAIAAADENSTVTLLNDTTEDVTIDKNITLDLGGKTLTNTGAGKATITITKDATATVKNGSVVGGAKYYNIAVGTAVNSTANLTLVDVTATAGNNGSSMIDNFGTLTITSGTYTGGLNVVKSEEGSKLTINGGKFTLEYATSGYTGVIFAYGDTTITGGEFIQSLTTTGRWNHPQVIATGVVEGYTAITRVTGGTFTNKLSGEGIFRGVGKGTSDNFEVSGGTFNKSISEGFCADGFIPTKNADGTYGVKEGKYVAKIGSTSYETLAAAIAKATSKSKPVTLVADVTESIEIAENKTCKIDLNGFTLTNTEGSHTIVNNGTLTIMDSSAAKSGTVDNVTHARAAIVNYGTMTLAGGTYTRSKECGKTPYDANGNSFYTILNDKGGSLTIKDGVTVTNAGHFSSMICNGNEAVEDTTLTIEGGLFSGGINTIKNGEFGKLTINGGSFTNATQCVVMNWNEASITDGTFELASGVNSTLLFSVSWSEHAIGKMTISGGTFKYTETQGLVQDTYNGGQYSGTLAVSGGTFDCAVDTKYCAEGFEPTKNVDGTYGVKETLAAKIGDTEYETLAAAFAAAKDGDTIVLLKNSSGNGIVVKVGTFADKGLTVDFNNHSYTVGGVLVGSSGTASNGFQLNKDNKITFKNGALYGDASVAGDKTTNWTGAPAIMIQNYSNLTLEMMTVVGGKETCYTISNNCGDTLIKNSTITAGEASTKPAYQPARAFDVCGFSTYPGATVTVENSTINGAVEISNGNNSKVALTIGKGTTVSGSLVDGGNGDKVAVTKDNSVDVTAPDGYKWVDGEAGQTLAKIVMVAEVNGKQYETLQAAIDAAGRKQTVKLLKDTTENVTMATSDLTLDLNGHTLNGGQVKGKPALTVTARVTVMDSSAEQTGTIKREDKAENSGVSSHYVIDVQGAGWLTFESGNVTNDSGVVGVKGASLVRVGGDTVATYPGLNIKGGNFQQDNFIAIKVDRGDLFLNGGTITSKNSYAIENWHRATIKGGTVKGSVASWTYSGGSNSTTTIIGGTINGNVNSVNYGNAEGKTAKVTISGGTVNGELDTRSYDPTTNELTSIDDAAKATIGVTGGTFSTDPTKYVVEGSSVTTNSDGTFGVEKAYLATVGDKSYYTMEEAFKAQTASGEAIVLLRDYTTGSSFPSGSINRTVDLNNHTWTYTGKDTNCAAFEVNNSNVSLTVKNGTVVSGSMIGLIPSASSLNGTITRDNSGLVFESVEATANGHSGIETNGNNTNDTVTLKNSTLNVPNGFGIYFPSSGKLTIDNSKITAKTLGVQVCSGSLDIKGQNAAITVNGDPVPKTENDGAIQDGAAISIVNRTGYKGLGTITVTEGTFKAKEGNAAVKAYDWSNKEPGEANFTASGNVNISGGSYSTAVPEDLCAEGFVPVTNGDGTYGVQPDGNVAEIGSMKYKSLDEALKAAKDRETVKLLKDVEATQVLVTKGTLDLNGKTLKVSYFMSFSDVIDSTEGNGLIETGVQSFFTTNNSYLPLRDSAANGYRLFSYKLNKLGVVEGSSTAFWFNIIFGGEKAYSLLNTAGHNADLFIPMQIGSGNEWQYIKMNQSTLTKWTTPILNGTAPSKCGYYVNITGLDTLTSGTVLTLKTSIRSCGVEKLSDDSLTYTVK